MRGYNAAVRRLRRILLNAATVASLAIGVSMLFFWSRSDRLVQRCWWSNTRTAFGFDVSRGLVRIHAGRSPRGAFVPSEIRTYGRPWTLDWRYLPNRAATYVVYASAGDFAVWKETAPFGAVDRYLLVPCWGFCVVALLLPTLRAATAVARWGRAARAARRRTAGRCPSCGYNLRATPDRCPECGAVQRISLRISN